MSKVFSVNNTPATGTIAMYALITFLIARGWVKTRDSDGTTFSSTGVQVTGSGSGANGLGNTNAWVELRSSDSTVFLTFQRGSTDVLWRIKIGRAAFSSGSPGAAQTGATATPAQQEILWIGGGTDAAPTYTTLYPTNGTYKQHLCADNAAPWGWWQITPTNTTGIEANGTLIFDPTTNGPAADLAPWVVWGAAGAGVLMSVGTTNNEGVPNIRCFLGFATTPAAVAVAAMAFSSAQGTSTNGLGGFNSNTGLEDSIAVPFGRYGTLAAPVGWKGVSTMVRFSYSTIRSQMSTLNTGGTIDKVIYGTQGYVLDWPNTAPVL